MGLHTAANRCLFNIIGRNERYTMPFFTQSLPEAHLQYLHIQNGDIHIELKNLDAAFIYAIGGCLIGIGIGALTAGGWDILHCW